MVSRFSGSHGPLFHPSPQKDIDSNSCIVSWRPWASTSTVDVWIIFVCALLCDVGAHMPQTWKSADQPIDPCTLRDRVLCCSNFLSSPGSSGDLPISVSQLFLGDDRFQATISSFYVGFTDWNSKPDPCLGKNFYLLSHLSELTRRRKVWSSHLVEILWKSWT